MNLEELNKLEEKVNQMVKGLKLLREENARLKNEIQELKNTVSVSSTERSQIKEKVSTLITLIESIESETV